MTTLIIVLLALFVSIVWFIIGFCKLIGEKHQQIELTRWAIVKNRTRELLIMGPLTIILFVVVEKLEKTIRRM